MPATDADLSTGQVDRDVSTGRVAQMHTVQTSERTTSLLRVSPSMPPTDPAAFRADVGEFYGPVTEAPVSSIRDVILCPTGVGGGDVDDYRTAPPVGAPILRRFDPPVQPGPAELGRDMRIGRLEDHEASMVFRACTPRGHHFAPIKQFGQRYSFIREVRISEWQSNPYRWDPDGVLHDALAMSRLVRDNAVSLEYAARIVTWEDGEQVISWTGHGPLNNAYTVRHERDWLTYEEAAELRALLASYWEAKDDLPQRVTRAMWRAEYASAIRWGDVSLPTIVSGLEALLKTERHAATRQFKERACALADELGVSDVTESWAEGIYDARSDWVHGSSVTLFALDPALSGGPSNPSESQAFQDLARVQDLLRAAIRRAIEDKTFRARFESDDSVRSHWPLT